MQSIQYFLKQFLVMYMTFFLTFSPLTVYGAGLTPDGTTQTTIGQAGNGVPTVNIAKPSASGLSHNRFSNYNVNANGLILNNGTTPTVNTQLGGVIGKNPHLTAPARVILNEVTSTNRSALNGYTEVGGSRADLVIANPNGLTINGAGFINTGNVTLTTGKPVIVGGALKSLNVTGGDIAIQGTGLNTSGQTSTAIYTQYLNLNAKLHAQNLDIKLGGNNIDYVTKNATANAVANARTVLLDASALGGMYANRIILVGTDTGLGVNLPPEVLASAGDISITNDGNISLQKVSATNNINITSVNGVTLSKNLYSGANTSITAGSNINVNAGVVAAAKNVMTIHAAQLSNAGTMVAGVNTNQTQNTTGTMNITATTLNNTGDIQSTGNLVASGTTFTNDGVFNAGNDLTLNTSNLTNNKTLFAGNNMNLYTTGTLSNTANSTIFALNNLTMSANVAGGKSVSIINTQADMQALNGNINVNALSFQNITTAPVIGVTNSTSGTASIATDFLQSRGKEAQLLSGGNMNLNADTILNNYSLISAASNINVTSNSLTNQFVNLNEVTLTPTLQSYIFYTRCGFLGQGRCSNVGYRTVNVASTQVIGNVSSTIQASGNITGNVGNLNSLGITPSKVITTAPSSALQQTLPANNTLAISLPTGTQGLFVVASNPQSNYLIVTNPKFAIFGNFISSSFLLNNLNFSSDRTLKLLGDAFYENKLIRESIFAQTGKRFLTSSIKSDNAQYQYLMDNALAAQQDLQLIPGVSLTQAQMALLKHDIVWLEEQEVAGQKVLVPVVYLANAKQYKLEGGMIVAGDDVNLLVSNLNNQGLLEAGNNVTLQASDSIINQKGTIRAGNDVSLTAQNDIKNISALIEGKNITLVASNGNIINQRQTKTVTNRDADGYDTQTQIGLAGNIEAKNRLNLQAGENISIEGSRLKGQDVSLATKEVTITTTVNNFDSFAGSHGSYIKEQSTEHLASNIEGENVAINSTGITTVRGGNVHADKNLNITAKAIDIVAVNDSSYREFKVVKKGLISKSEVTTKKESSTNVAAKLSAKNINIHSNQVILSASTIKANTIKISTELLNLISQKDIDYAQTQTDGSGILIRKITDQGHYNQTIVEASIRANKLIFNGQDISQSLSTQNIEAQLIKTLSSQDVLSRELKEKGINLYALTANNKNWNESMTTLSGVGKLIVMAVVTYFTAGAGTGLVEASSAAMQTVVDAAMNSLINQAASQIAESAITGNTLQFDVNAIVTNAVIAGAASYAQGFIDKNTTNALAGAKGEYMSVKDYAKNAVVQGSVEGIKSELRGGKFKNGFKIGAALSVISDSALQMRKNVIDNYDYAGKDGSSVPEKIQSAGVRGDGKKIAGSHPILSEDGKSEIKIDAPFGGSQMGERKIVGQGYDEGGVVDNALESFAGPHDFMSSWNYKNVDGKTYLKGDGVLTNIGSGVLLIPAAPFAAAPIIQDNLDAVQILRDDIQQGKQRAEEFKLKNRSNP